MEEMSCRPQRPHFSTAVMRDARCEQSTRLLPRAGRQGEEQRLRARSADPVRGAPRRAATGFPSGSLILAVGSGVIANHQPAASPAATGGRGRLADLRHHLRVRDGRSPDRKSCDGADVNPPPHPCAVLCAPGAAAGWTLVGPVQSEGREPLRRWEARQIDAAGRAAGLLASAQRSSIHPYASRLLPRRRWWHGATGSRRAPATHGDLGSSGLLRSALILVHGAALSSSPFSKVNK